MPGRATRSDHSLSPPEDRWLVSAGVAKHVDDPDRGSEGGLDAASRRRALSLVRAASSLDAGTKEERDRRERRCMTGRRMTGNESTVSNMAGNTVERRSNCAVGARYFSRPLALVPRHLVAHTRRRFLLCTPARSRPQFWGWRAPADVERVGRRPPIPKGCLSRCHAPLSIDDPIRICSRAGLVPREWPHGHR